MNPPVLGDHEQVAVEARREVVGVAPAGNPRAEQSSDFDAEAYNIRATGQPDLWCDWEVCREGDCLTWNGTEKSYRMVEWLTYLTEHFLRPGGRAESIPGFAGFTFDDVVTGMVVVGCRRRAGDCGVSPVRA